MNICSQTSTMGAARPFLPRRQPSPDFPTSKAALERAEEETSPEAPLKRALTAVKYFEAAAKQNGVVLKLRKKGGPGRAQNEHAQRLRPRAPAYTKQSPRLPQNKQGLYLL